MDGSIITYTGKRFYPLNPKPEDIDPIDIAHSIAQQCRYTGHVNRFYSVATHSILIHDWLVKEGASEDICRWALAHDWTEAYLLDLAAPLKHHPDGFGDQFREVEGKIERAIADRFDLKLPLPPEVKAIDLQIRAIEMETLLPPVVWEDWGEKLPISIPDWGPIEGKFEMLWRMKTYGIVERNRSGNFQTAREYALV